MQIRHSHLLSQAHFLHTRTEPKLVSKIFTCCYDPFLTLYQYYKPWELLKQEEEDIKGQIKEAGLTIEQELAQYEQDHGASPKPSGPEVEREASKEDSDPIKFEENGNLGQATDQEQPTRSENNDADPDTTAASNPQPPPTAQADVSKDAGDDGGEVVEGDEDTVIY